MVAQNHVGDAGEVDPEVAGVLEHGFGAEAGVEQDSPPIGLDQRGEPPLAHALVGQHGGQDGDLEGRDLVER